VILRTQLTWSNHINQVGSKASQRLWVQSPVFDRSGLSIRQCSSYKRLIRPMMENAYPIRRFAASTHVRKSQVVKSKRTLVSTDSLTKSSGGRSRKRREIAGRSRFDVAKRPSRQKELHLALFLDVSSPSCFYGHKY